MKIFIDSFVMRVAHSLVPVLGDIRLGAVVVLFLESIRSDAGSIMYSRRSKRVCCCRVRLSPVSHATSSPWMARATSTLFIVGLSQKTVMGRTLPSFG